MKYLINTFNLDNSCLTRKEKEEVRDLLYEYKDAFSLRAEIGTYPNIEVEIDIMGKTPFFIRPFHAKEEDKSYIGQRDEEVMLCRNFERRFFSLL